MRPFRRVGRCLGRAGGPLRRRGVRNRQGPGPHVRPPPAAACPPAGAARHRPRCGRRSRASVPAAGSTGLPGHRPRLIDSDAREGRAASERRTDSGAQPRPADRRSRRGGRRGHGRRTVRRGALPRSADVSGAARADGAGALPVRRPGRRRLDHGVERGNVGDPAGARSSMGRCARGLRRHARDRRARHGHSRRHCRAPVGAAARAATLPRRLGTASGSSATGWTCHSRRPTSPQWPTSSSKPAAATRTVSSVAYSTLSVAAPRTIRADSVDGRYCSRFHLPRPNIRPNLSPIDIPVSSFASIP